MPQRNNRPARAAAFAVLAFCHALHAGDVSTLASTSVVTNGNGTVTKTYTETSVATNGTFVTERRKETRTRLDQAGNLLETATSEYVESFSSLSPSPKKANGGAEKERLQSFLGFKFGDVFDGESHPSKKRGEEHLLWARATPKKTLEGFDDYILKLSPSTRRIVKVEASAKKPIPFFEDGTHYLIDAISERFGARPYRRSLRPVFSFEISPRKTIYLFLDGHFHDCGTVISAEDRILEMEAMEEYRLIREELKQKEAAERIGKINAAKDAL